MASLLCVGEGTLLYILANSNNVPYSGQIVNMACFLVSCF